MSVALAESRTELAAPITAPRIRFRHSKGTGFYLTLRDRVDDYFLRSAESRFADWTIWTKAAAFFALAIGSYIAILTGRFGLWPMLALANVYGLASLLLAVNAGHDGAHAALSPRAWINNAVLYGSFTLIGADPYLWRMRHVRSHHVFPNVNGCDIDIDSNLFLRLSPNHPKRRYQRYQHLYAPFVFWIVDIHTVFIQDVHYLFKRQLANMNDIRHPASAYVNFVLCKLVYLSIVLFIPVLLLPIPWWQVAIGSVLMSFVSSCAFVYLLIGTHFAEATKFPESNADGVIDGDWATHAMVTSLDWNPDSRFACAIAGGANAHAAHHLFPNLSHRHYRALTPIIVRTAKEFRVPYNATTFSRMIASHFRFLKRVGRSERPEPARPAQFVCGNSSIELRDGIWRMHIHESGDYAAGLAAGRLLKMADYPGIRFCSRGDVTAVFQIVFLLIGRDLAKIRIPRRFLDELQGYADATGIPYRTLFCMNFFFDVLKKYGFHCSSVAVMEHGATLVGRNTDLIPWIARLALKWFPSLVLEVTMPSGRRYAHFTPALFLGAFNGFNDRGIAVLSHQVAATKEKSVAGNLATTLLQRMLLEQATCLSHAEELIRANPIQRCVSNMIVSASEGASRIFEISPAAVKAKAGSPVSQCCVTHFQDEELAKLHRRFPAESHRRLALMNRIATRTKPHPFAIIRLLRNCDNGTSHRNSGCSPTNDGTYQSLVLDLTNRKMFISDGTRLPVSLSGTYREVQLRL
jgi:linoleoyl-CoA desaturase